MTELLLSLSVLNVVLQIVTYRRNIAPVPGMDYRAAAVISGLLWLFIATWCVGAMYRGDQ